MLRVLKRITRQARKRELNLNSKGKQKWGMTPAAQNPDDLPSWMQPKEGDKDATLGAVPGCMCPIDAFKVSPATEKYRNKNEFSIGRDTAGEIAVGFRTGSFLGGSVTVDRPDKCINIPDSCKDAALRFEEFLTSSLEVYDTKEHRGVWRGLLTKWSQQGTGLMVSVRYNPEGVDAAKMEDELARAQNVFVGEEQLFGGEKVTSFYLHPFSSLSAPKDEDLKLQWGSPTIIEHLEDQSFEISPAAFFQVAACRRSVVQDRARVCEC